MKNIDQSKDAFDEYKLNIEKFILEDLSESDTRSKLIDSILIDVLGWDESDIRREGKVDSGYYDYRVSIPGLHFILEAKRQFKELQVPANHKKVLLKTLHKGNEDVINQTRNYCMDEGIPYGVVTNGRQFIILKSFNTDNKPWKENSCLVFKSLDDIEKRFIEFYENLSKCCLVYFGCFKYDLPIANIEFKTILSTLIDKDKELIRNQLSAIIVPLIDIIFGEIFSEEREDDNEFIKYCFIENEETKKNKNEIERLFGDYAPNLNRVVPAVNSKSIANQISSELSNDDITLKNNYPPKPIIIIGSKGAGKTTFINHLFKYKLNEEEIESHLLIYLDFRKFFENETSFDSEKIIREILESVYTKYENLNLHSLKVLKRIYIKEIRRNDESIWLFDKEHDQVAYQKSLSSFFVDAQKDIVKHIELLSKYLIREHRKRLVVIIDNADQFKDTIQEKLFVFAHSLTKSSLCGTVISLREGYYYKWQNSPPFDAYESNVYHITAPNYSEILQRRIDFAIEKAPQFEKKVRGKNQSGITIEFPTDYIKNYLSTLKNSLFSSNNSEIIEFLSYTTYPNIREGLKEFKYFLTSGHTKVTEYILREQYRTKNNLTHQAIPIHEFIKSIGLENRHYYNSEISKINNILVPIEDSTDHFLLIYLLKDLHEFVEKENYTERYIPHTTLLDKLSSIGYKVSTLNLAIIKLMKYGLIDTDDQLSDIHWKELLIPTFFNVGLTQKGHYYLMKMIYRFHYYDLIIQDTPIFDMTYFDNIRTSFPLSDETGQRSVEQRIQTIRTFLNYLKHMEDTQSNKIKTVYGGILDSIKASVENEISNIPSRYKGALNNV